MVVSLLVVVSPCIQISFLIITSQQCKKKKRDCVRRRIMRRSLQKWAKPTIPSAGGLTEVTKTAALSLKDKKGHSQELRRQRKEDIVRKIRTKRTKLIRNKTIAMREELTRTTNARDVLVAQLADQIFSRGHEFHSTACNVSFVPDGNPACPEVALVGRSKVGKTSLLRALFRESRAAGRGATPVRCDAMNFYAVGGGVFNICDTPGFGGTSVPWSVMLQFAVLIRNFVRSRPNLKMLYYCMDVHPKYGMYIQDIDILKFMSAEVPNFTIVLTKGDHLSQSKSLKGASLRQDEDASYFFTPSDVRKELIRNDIEHPVLVTSAFEMGGIDTLRYDMVMNVVHSLPTEKLTLTEARKLSERLMTQAEIASVRPLSIAPTEVDDQLREWNAEIEEERLLASGKESLQLGSDGEGRSRDDGDNGCPAGPVSVTEGAVADLNTRLAQNTSELSCAPKTMSPYQTLMKKLNNDSLLKYVHDTSPWRNPAIWPRNVVPTKHPRKNIMRCPEDPDNPYLTQPHFVAPRADMYFRRPNVGCRRGAEKGRYEADVSIHRLSSQRYSIPYFPDIVDVNMFPMPWMFLGSKEAYYETPGGRALGVKLTRYVTAGQINPLSDNPAPENPLMTGEVRKLEEKRYGCSIAHLTPRRKTDPQLPAGVSQQ